MANQKQSKMSHTDQPLMSKKKNLNVPSELFFDIMSRIPAKSVVRFKSLSKQWCSTILEDPYILHQPPLQTVRTQTNLGIILGNHIGESSIEWTWIQWISFLPQICQTKEPKTSGEVVLKHKTLPFSSIEFPWLWLWEMRGPSHLGMTWIVIIKRSHVIDDELRIELCKYRGN